MGVNPLLLLDELRQLGTCEVVCHHHDIPDLNHLDPQTCYVFWDILLTTTQDINAVKDVFIFVEDQCALQIDLIDSDSGLDDEVEYKRLGEILVQKGDVSEQAVAEVVDTHKKMGEMLIDANLVNKSAVDSALIEQQHIRQKRETRQTNANAASIRVAADKLDALVDLVGELVTVQARLSQVAGQFESSELLAVAEQVERLTANLRDNTMSVRMLPIGSTFSRFKRLVRDLSQDLGKQVDLVTEGGETELDKTVIERLNDPLVHIIRNSIDHGIESADVRKAAGKPLHGRVQLKALHSGANVLIKISDDGAGLDANAIRSKAIQKKMIDPGSVLSDKDLFSLIFAPGFSTAKQVTDVSGRGVGMDVVKKSIEGLRGSIEIDSQKGIGSTITLKLPLTLAIIDGLLVMIGKTQFVIPLSAVKECVELTRDDIRHTHGRHLANVRGNLVPYINLRQMFAINGNIPAIQQIAITEIDGTMIGLVVDRVIGQHQTVIKSMGRAYRDVKSISGATILGDGSLALILDIFQIAQSAHELEAKLG